MNQDAIRAKRAADLKGWTARENVLRQVARLVDASGRAAETVRDERGRSHDVPVAFHRARIAAGMARYFLEEGDEAGELDHLAVDETALWKALARVVCEAFVAFAEGGQSAEEWVEWYLKRS